MNKELIIQRFSRKLNSYNANARVQKLMATKLINTIDSIQSNTFLENSKISILEIGCGTGLLTELAAQNIAFSSYTALDIVPECENFIKSINPKIEFVSNDIEKYIDEVDKKFDLIISNASLQWIENLSELIKKLVEKINPNGMLLFSTFGRENFREIYYVIGKTLQYLSKSELETLLAQYKPDIEEEIRIIAFKTPKDVLKHIQSTGVNAIISENWTKKDLLKFESKYNSFCANHPTLTYNPIYVKIQKNIFAQKDN